MYCIYIKIILNYRLQSILLEIQNNKLDNIAAAIATNGKELPDGVKSSSLRKSLQFVKLQILVNRLALQYLLQTVNNVAEPK